MLARRRRRFLPPDGRLLIIAADHPARGLLTTGPAHTSMGDRYELLERLAIALDRPGVDGVLGTADIIDDLALLGLLDDRVVIGSMNRGGLDGSRFEVDDRYTGHDIAGATASGLDGVKLLLRLDLDDPRSAAALERAAVAVRAAAAARVPILLEPFLSESRDGRLCTRLDADSMIHAISIATALGSSTAYSWLKLPVVPEMDRVMRSTTLPTLLLGGDVTTDPDATYDRWASALALPGVRGLVVGRSMLYPADGDVARHVEIAARLVHGH